MRPGTDGKRLYEFDVESITTVTKTNTLEPMIGSQSPDVERH